MKNTLKLEDLQNALDTFKQHNPELNGLILHKADARCGKRIALARTTNNGCLDTKTDYMTYSEMNMFLYGYYFKSIKKFAS